MKKPPRPIATRASDSPLSLQEISMDPEKHAAFKEQMFAAARSVVEAFPAQVEEVRNLLRRGSPADLLAIFASYGMQAGITDKGEIRPALQGIEQSHGELLQAIVLSLPAEEWGDSLPTPNDMQVLFDAMPGLASAFFMGRILDGQALQDDKEALTVRSLQERIRMHTHTVRNWGYFEHVVQLSRDLYAPLDATMRAHHGFSATDLIDVLHALVDEFQRRQSAHWALLGKVLKGKTPRHVLELYFRHFPQMVGTPEQMLSTLPRSITRRDVMGMLMAHQDLRLCSTATFTSAAVAELTGRTEEVTSSILSAISFKPGALCQSKPEFLFLDNPVWDRPAIDLGDYFLVPMPQMSFSHIHRLMDRLVSEAGMQVKFKDRRAEFLEQRLAAIMRKALPDADVRESVKWSEGDTQYENDLIVIVDRVVIIAEAKSHRLTPQGLRGAAERVKRHIKEMILDPSVQSARLERHILAAREGDDAARQIVTGIGIDPDRADRVVRLSVTLDDLSVLSSSEHDFKEVGWVPQDHFLAPSILIADLNCLADILDNQLLFLHYLSERAHLQKTLNLLGDELDFLGLYLASCFNLKGLESEDRIFAPTGMSGPIDRYYMGREAGVKVPKPVVALRPLFRDIVQRLTTAKPPGWTLMGFDLLSSADPSEQRAIERNLAKLRTLVRKHHRNPRHHSTLIIKPPERRKALVLFYLYTEGQPQNHHGHMEELASEAAESESFNEVVVFARSTERWARPFESVMLWRS